MRIFYSWQLDAPRKINKDFIHHALTHAVSMLSEDPDVSTAEREELDVDQDTQGVLGSPDVVRVILEKIAKSDLIVSDVSLVGVGKNDKKHINSNVAIELGYAYGVLGDKFVLKVMNTHFGTPEELPFDLRTKRHPVQFSLKPRSDPEEIKAEQQKLAKQLAAILKLYLKDSVRPTSAPHEEIPDIGQQGIFWRQSEPLVPESSRRFGGDLFSHSQRIAFFRCIPPRSLPELSSREAYDLTSDLWPLLSEGGYSRSRNKWGALSHCVARDEELMGFTQVFRNREIWGVDFYFPNSITHPDDDQEEPIEYLPTGAVNREYPRSIDSMREVALKMDYGDRYEIEIGFSGIEGISLAVKREVFMKPFIGPIYSGTVSLRRIITSEQSTRELLNDFWRLVFDEAGAEPPDYLMRAGTD